MRIIDECKRAIVAGAMALAFLSSTNQRAQASLIELLNWAPVPDSVNAEIDYNTTTGLQTGPGAIGNGDGTLPVGAQTPGGLQSDTVVTVPGTIPGSFPSSLFTGGTGFYDTTLTFTGLAPVGNAASQVIPIPPSSSITVDSQALGPGTFTLTSTTPLLGGNPNTETVLLTGTISAATVVTGVDGGTAGATFNSEGVTYTGGAIFAAFPSNYIAGGNDLSVSLSAISPAFSINGTSGQLNSFSADATGEFDVGVSAGVPEPATFAIAGFSLLALGSRRRSMRR